ncbi:hypothetical protein DFH07DRAFT_958634 [Mycena maculata]|uniref:Uncharacterized protein n=1 Tax=Mycena maculata TaxID=230809 RepID=A0AAD7J8C9_9AGAR|nr:hypothetical protein DFH07DRAFT_958634 [Mycena maculata]
MQMERRTGEASNMTAQDPSGSSMTGIVPTLFTRNSESVYGPPVARAHADFDYDALPHPDMPSVGAALVCLHSLVLMISVKTDSRWAHERLRKDGFGDVQFYMPPHAHHWRVVGLVDVQNHQAVTTEWTRVHSTEVDTCHLQ